MPDAADLPRELAALARYNALELGDARFEADFARLMEALDPAGARRPGAADSAPSGGGRLRRVLAGAAGAAVLAAAGWWLLPAWQRFALPEQAAAVDGDWVASVTYAWGTTHEERFVFTTHESQLLGTAGFLGLARPIVAGSVEGAQIAFTTRSQEGLGREVRDLVHGYRGSVEGDAIRFVLITQGGNAGDPVEFVARRGP
jgi:hypothetical protein